MTRPEEKISQLEAANDALRSEIANREKHPHESEDHYRDLVESSHDLICTHDLEGRLLSVNEAAVPLTGYSREALLRMNVSDLLDADLHGDFEKYLEKVRTTGRARGLMRIRTGNGETRFWEYDNSLRTGDTTVPVVRGMAHDITDRRRAEEALREREIQLRLFVEYGPAAIAMFDRDMRYLVASRRWYADFGIVDQDIIGRSHYEVFPDIPERWKAVHRRCLAGAVERCDEDPFPRSDGHLDWVRWEVRPWRHSNGEVGGIIIFTEVITEKKAADLELRESEARLRLALDAAHMGMFDWDIPRNRITWSRRTKSSGVSRRVSSAAPMRHSPSACIRRISRA